LILIIQNYYKISILFKLLKGGIKIDKVFKTLGSSAHSLQEREENDYYTTPEVAVLELLKREKHNFKGDIWECACGSGNISKVLERELNTKIYSTDLYDRGYGISGIDFLNNNINKLYDVVITNPPFKYAKEFCLKGIEHTKEGGMCYMLLRTLFLEGQARYKELFKKYPPKYIYVFSKRIDCLKNDMPSKYGNAQSYSWFCWQKGYTGETIIKWITY
jgi:hypothetical protein